MHTIEVDPHVINLPDNMYEDANESLGNIITVQNSDLSYSAFFEHFMLKNRPCLMKNVSTSWMCSKTWVKNNKTIDDCYLVQNYGDLVAPVADCGSTNFGSHCKADMYIKDYITYLSSKQRDKILYLKDWHLKRLRPNDNFYELPPLFSSDWLNEFAVDLGDDDFMFVYIGPQGSWTPLHVDVYNSYSWSVNVVGRKKWILLPPGEEEKLKDSSNNLPISFSTSTVNLKYVEVIQEKGDAIFVPSGWHHQVENLDDTISINHNWVNGCNIEAVWIALQKCLLSVENEIIDLKNIPEFTSQCQLILKSLFGMDFKGFLDLLFHISKKRIAQFQGEHQLNSNRYKLGTNHIKFDLKQLYKIMDIIQHHYLFSQNYLSFDFISQFNDLKHNLLQLLNS